MALGPVDFNQEVQKGLTDRFVRCDSDDWFTVAYLGFELQAVEQVRAIDTRSAELFARSQFHDECFDILRRSREQLDLSVQLLIERSRDFDFTQAQSEAVVRH